MHDHSGLLTRISLHQAKHFMSDTAFGRLAVNDGKLIPRLRAGASVTLNTLKKVDEFLSRASAPATAA